MASNEPDSASSSPVQQVCVVEEQLHGSRLGDYLTQRWPLVDRVFLRNLVLEGRAAVNGDPVGLRTRLRAGDVLIVELPCAVADLPGFAADQDCDELLILHEDDEVVVVDKPAGVPCVADRAGKYPGVQGRLEATRPGLSLRIVDRREPDVSGCTLFAKSLAGHRRLLAARQARQLVEEYRALVVGVLRSAECRVERSLGPDPRRPGRVAVVGARSRGARPASSLVQLEQAFRAHSMVRVVPETARSQQVRVHLAHLGHPVVADRDYGVGDKLLLSEVKRGYKSRPGVVERPLLSRMFLHVARLSWPGPDGRVHSVEANLPRELDLVLSKLKSFASSRRP